MKRRANSSNGSSKKHKHESPAYIDAYNGVKYKVMNVPGDGHCMYRSILDASRAIGKEPGTQFGTEFGSTTQDIVGARGFRKKVVEIIKKDKEIFPEAEFGNWARRYKAEMLSSINNGDYGDDTILKAIARHYKLDIATLKENGEKYNREDIKDGGIVLLLTGNGRDAHYDWLQPVESEEDGEDGEEVKLKTNKLQLKF